MQLRMVLCACTLLAAGGCGGGSAGEASANLQGSTESRTLTSRANGNTYPLRIYLPPSSAGARDTLPIVYALDGDWWFEQLVDIVEARKAGVIVVGIGNNANRATDYVPPNSCTPGGGGQAAYWAFIRSELIPHMQATVGGHPLRRALLGHSHGGSFVYYAMFADAPGGHPFSAYLASDSSISCLAGTALGWEAAYAARFATLPVRLHVSHTPLSTPGMAFAQQIQDRRYAGLQISVQTFAGSHTGIIPAAFADALEFAFRP